MDHPPPFKGEYWDGYVVGQGTRDNEVLVYNEATPMHPLRVIVARMSPLTMGMIVQTPKEADVTLGTRAYRVVTEDRYELDKHGRVKIDNALITFCRGFDDEESVHYGHGWCPEVDRVAVMKPFEDRLKAPLMDGRLYKGTVVCALMSMRRSLSTASLEAHQERVQTRWVVVRNSLVEVRDLKTLKEFRSYFENPSVANRDKNLPIWLEVLRNVWHPRPQIQLLANLSSSGVDQANTCDDDLDEVGTEADSTSIRLNSQASDWNDNISQSSQSPKPSLPIEQTVALSDPESAISDTHTLKDGEAASANREPELHMQQSSVSPMDETPLAVREKVKGKPVRPMKTEKVFRSVGLVVGIHEMYSIVWTQDFGPKKMRERNIVGVWLDVKMSDHTNFLITDFRRRAESPFPDIYARFIRYSQTECEKGNVYVTCICNVVAVEEDFYLFRNCFLGQIRTPVSEIKDTLYAGMKIVTEFVAVHNGRAGFELAKYHGEYSKKNDITLENPCIPYCVSSLQEYEKQILEMKKYEELEKERGSANGTAATTARNRAADVDNVNLRKPDLQIVVPADSSVAIPLGYEPLSPKKSIFGRSLESSASSLKIVTSNLGCSPTPPSSAPSSCVSDTESSATRSSPSALTKSSEVEESSRETKYKPDQNGLVEVSESSTVDNVTVVEARDAFASQMTYKPDTNTSEESGENDVKELSPSENSFSTSVVNHGTDVPSVAPEELVITPSDLEIRESPIEATWAKAAVKEQPDEGEQSRVSFCLVTAISAETISLVSPVVKAKVLLRKNVKIGDKAEVHVSDLRIGDWIKVICYPRKTRSSSHDVPAHGFMHIASELISYVPREQMEKELKLVQRICGPFIKIRVTLKLYREDAANVVTRDKEDWLLLHDKTEDLPVRVPSKRLIHHLDVKLKANFRIRFWASFVAIDEGVWLTIPDSTPIFKKCKGGTWTPLEGELSGELSDNQNVDC